jgi:hypothetical protein
VLRSARILTADIDDAGAAAIARRSRGTARIANRLLARVHDYAVARGDGLIREGLADEALAVYEIDGLGLDKVDRAILDAVVHRFSGGPVGLSTLAIAVGEEPETVEDAYEPFLLQLGLIQRTARGRMATAGPTAISAWSRRPRATRTRHVMDISRFDYDLPEAAIAQTPVEPRDAARLLDTRDLSDHRFSDLPGLLREGDLVVVNTTRVRRARLVGEKADTGGAVEILLLERRLDGLWSALVKPARRIRAGQELRFGDLLAVIREGPEQGVVAVELSDDALVEATGSVPLPPYITTELADSERYQTVYARATGSAAAPTAGLHFTPEVLAGLRERGSARLRWNSTWAWRPSGPSRPNASRTM